MVLRFTTLLRCHPMAIVEADQPLSTGPVQRQRIVDAVRLLQRGRHSRHHKPHPMTAVGIDDEHLPVEVQKYIEGIVARFEWLSV